MPGGVAIRIPIGGRSGGTYGQPGTDTPYGQALASPMPQAPDFSHLLSSFASATGAGGDIPKATAANKLQSGSGNAATQAAALGGGSGTTNVAQDPELKKIQGEYQDYLGQLGGNSNQENINSMANQRDAISGMAKEAEANAAERGFSSDTGVSNTARQSAYDAGARSLAALNAANTSSAIDKKAGVLAGATGAAGTAANVAANQQNYALQQSKYQQDTLNFQAQLAAMQQQNSFNNMLGLLQTASSFYSGL